MSALRPIGSPENFYIHDGYTVRPEVPWFDARDGGDDWQIEVYEKAKEVVDAMGLDFPAVLDFGCGTASKLLKYFSGRYAAIGVERQPILGWLREQYPDRYWCDSLPTRYTQPGEEKPFDLIICADVIEHVEDPHSLLSYLRASNPVRLVISTPDPTLMGLGTEDGPPKNRHHIREWNMPQFHALLSDYFRVMEHTIINQEQYTQMAICFPK